MTQDLDALPLPVPTHFRNGVLYAFSADQIRAARREGYELAMRKAQEGRGPVVLPDGFFDALSDLLGDSNMAERVHRLITSWCDTSPPPKSDEARDALTQAAIDVLAERQRQISAEGWTPEHDDEHSNGEMGEAAACYAASARLPAILKKRAAPAYWPWDATWWKPSSPRRDLIKAGALILAEIERLDRAALAAQQKGGAV